MKILYDIVNMHRYADRKGRRFGFGEPRTTIFKALSCEHRVMIIEILKYGKQSVSEIASFLAIHPSVVSRHLTILQSAGLVMSRKEGVEVYYKLSSEEVLSLLKNAKSIVELRMKSKGF